MDLELELGSELHGHPLMIRTQQQQQLLQQRQQRQHWQRQQQQRQQWQHQQQLLWTPSTASPLIFSLPAGAVSVPSYATGHPLMTSVGLV